MTITVIGTGFVGVVTSAVYSKFKNRVYGLDIDEQKIAKLSQGMVPFYEPELEDLVKSGIKSGNLTFTTSYEEAISQADIILIAVGTPSAPDGTADLKYVFAAAEAMAPFLKEGAIVALKSTVPPSTTTKVKEVIQQKTSVSIYTVSLPEFLREGSAVEDTLNPDRIVIGATEPEVIERLLTLHKPLRGKRIIVAPESAQMAKYTANAYLAQRITFINQIANLCEKNGAHIGEVIQAIGEDHRIGNHYWYPGLGYGGSCFPKDVKELAAYARSVGEGDGLLVKIDELNDQRIEQKLTEFEKRVGGFKGKTVAVLGLSFKPNTNDMREAPSLRAIPYLKERGATIKAWDPKVKEEARERFGPIFLADDPYQALEQAEIAMLLVEWPELTRLDLAKVKGLMEDNAWFIDTRNQYPSQAVEEVGLNYLGIGNP
jgi:UDPglucose 6-dehydrogenase